jgi:dual specificity tyrosine-phosphorylation-regulated kinase 2/3/4
MPLFARSNHSAQSSASSSAEQILGHAFPSSNTRLSMSQPAFPELRDLNDTSEFLPPLNFDDLHTSITGITSFGHEVNRFPTLTSGGLGSSISVSSSTIGQANGSDNQLDKVSRGASLVRRLSNARRQPSQSSVASTTAPSMPPPPNPNSSRRQSALSNAFSSNTGANSRQPRKSVGPGYPPTSSSRSASRDSRATAQTQASLMRSNSTTRSNRPGSSFPNANNDNLSTTSASRLAKTKSLQPPPRGVNSSYLLSQSVSSDTPGASPRPRNRPGAQSPSSANNANRRLSTVYVGGLGARTISPTDARRLRRLSSVPKVLQQPMPQPPQPMMPPPTGIMAPQLMPPQPLMPSISQPELFSTPRQTSQSPAAYVRKSSTPSSSRNTPDFIRRNAQAVSSPNVNSNNLRIISNAGARTSQILTGSRLPTAKPRNHSSAGFVEEEVPPVPAIPKAYESPKDQYHVDAASYFGSRKVSESEGRKSSTSNSRPNTAKLVPTMGPPIGQQATDNGKSESSKQATSNAANQQANNRHRRGMTVGTGSESERGQGPTSNLSTNKKHLQPPASHHSQLRLQKWIPGRLPRWQRRHQRETPRRQAHR